MGRQRRQLGDQAQVQEQGFHSWIRRVLGRLRGQPAAAGPQAQGQPAVANIQAQRHPVLDQTHTSPWVTCLYWYGLFETQLIFDMLFFSFFGMSCIQFPTSDRYPFVSRYPRLSSSTFAFYSRTEVGTFHSIYPPIPSDTVGILDSRDLYGPGS